MTVNSDARVTDLNADKVDGREASSFADGVDGVATNAQQLDGRDSTDFANTSHDHDGAFYASGTKVRDSDLLDGSNSTDFAPAYERTVLVSPVGTATQNGSALKNALGSITDATQTNPYLLKIEPGVYDLGAAPGLVMKSWVDVEGSGEGVTTLRSTGQPSQNPLCPTAGTVVGAANSELRFLTVHTTGIVEGWPTAIYNEAGPFRVTSATATVSGPGVKHAVVLAGASLTKLRQATVVSSGTGGSSAGWPRYQQDERLWVPAWGPIWDLDGHRRHLDLRGGLRRELRVLRQHLPVEQAAGSRMAGVSTCGGGPRVSGH